MKSLRTLLISAALTAGAATIPMGIAGALVTPTTGQPGAPSGVTCGSALATSTPGHSVSASGSAFNPSGTAGSVYAGNSGTASTVHSNSTAAVSEYDAACLQVSTHYFPPG